MAPSSGPPDRRASVNMRAVAERAGVAMSSVSRVLSGSPGVSEVMRHRVLDAVAALGYERNPMASSLRTGETHAIGFVAIDIANPIIAANSSGAATVLREHGYSLLIGNSGGTTAGDVEGLRQFMARRVDGLLLSLAEESHKATLSLLRQFDRPLVLIDRDVPRSIPAGQVLHDHAAGVVPAGLLLVSLGHRRITLITGAPRVRPSLERARALRQVAQEHPDVVIDVIPGAFTETHGYETTQALMRRAKPPTAIVVGGNQMLGGVLRAMRDLSVRIPDDVSLVTCDDVALAEFLDPPLARVTRDPWRAGAEGARLLIEQIHGARPRAVVLPTTFEPGASCGPAR